MEREYSYVLRTCNEDMTSHGGFTWPSEGPVEAPDWDPAPRCGHGLHGFLNGCGLGSLADWGESAKWLVVKVLTTDIVELGGKVKFPKGEVIFVGDRLSAIQRLEELAPECQDLPVIGADRLGKDGDIVQAGDHGLVETGKEGIARVQDRGTATAGNYGMAIAANNGVALSEVGGVSLALSRGVAEAGAYGLARAGTNGTAKVGAYGTAIAGIGGKAVVLNVTGRAIVDNEGTAIVCGSGIAQAGHYGKAQAGNFGIIQIMWTSGGRTRISTGYVGENGIKPDVLYELDDQGNFVEVQEDTPV